MNAGIERLLAAALLDPRRREALLKDPLKLAEAEGIALSDAEKAVIASVDSSFWAAMLRTFTESGRGPEPPADEGDVASMGIRADLPPEP